MHRQRPPEIFHTLRTRFYLGSSTEFHLQWHVNGREKATPHFIQKLLTLSHQTNPERTQILIVIQILNQWYECYLKLKYNGRLFLAKINHLSISVLCDPVHKFTLMDVSSLKLLYFKRNKPLEMCFNGSIHFEMAKTNPHFFSFVKNIEFSCG